MADEPWGHGRQIPPLDFLRGGQPPLGLKIGSKWRHSRHLGFTKILNISGPPARLDRFLSNFPGRRTESMDMFPMSFNL